MHSSGVPTICPSGDIYRVWKAWGKFDLDDVKVDGIPVPKVLIQTLVEKYVKPKYPEVDLKAPFDLPWGIRAIDIGQGRARIVY